jgi:type IV pilus assembly protein PilN
MRVIQALQGNRPVIVRLLDQLVRTVPEGVFYTSLQTDAQLVSIEGIAESNNRVSSLMRRLEASRWLQAPSLDAVQATPDYGTQATHFTLSVGIELPEEAVEQRL